MKRLALISLLLVSATIVAASGCAPSIEDDAESGEANATEANGSGCEIFDVPHQTFIDLKTFLEDPDRKNDPVAQKILKDVVDGKQACPKSFTEIQKSPQLQNCTLETRIISERSMYLNAPDIGRALASRRCGGNDPQVFFLVDPIRADRPEIPPDVEVLGNNTTEGIFSYYAREPKGGPRNSFDPKDRPNEPSIWKFYGTSVDFVTNGYDCDVRKFHGACQSRWAQDSGVKGNASGARCASCHPGGGMVQKELRSPWTYWQTDPGGYTKKHPDVYGEFQPGVSFESVTEDQNARWAAKRVEVLAKKSVAELLRPLFCTMDVNLASGGQFVTTSFLLDPQFAGGDFSEFDPTAYQAALTKLGSVIKTHEKPAITATDTPNKFMFATRSGLDEAYVRALIASKKVPEELVNAILFVDFTRPIYSPLRCGLASLADGITDPSKAKDELLRKTSGKSGAEGELNTALGMTSAQPKAEASKFLSACNARGKNDKARYAEDVVRVASHLHQVTRLMKVKLKVEKTELGILDFEETVPFTSDSDKPVQEMHLARDTCELVLDK